VSNTKFSNSQQTKTTYIYKNAKDLSRSAFAGKYIEFKLEVLWFNAVEPK
jgi:hypothetical protein